REILRRPGIGGRECRWIARRTRRAWQRDLGVWNQLLVVLERIVAVRTRGRRPDRARTLYQRLVYALDWKPRPDMLVRIWSGIRVRVIAVRDQRSRQDGRVWWNKVTEPGRPRPIVSDP